MVENDGLVFAARLAAAKLIKAEISHNPVDPGIERALETEVADIPERLEKGLLVNVFCIVLGTSKMQGQPEHLLLILANQCIECRPGARLGFANQGHFGGAGL